MCSFGDGVCDSAVCVECEDEGISASIKGVQLRGWGSLGFELLLGPRPSRGLDARGEKPRENRRSDDFGLKHVARRQWRGFHERQQANKAEAACSQGE